MDARISELTSPVFPTVGDVQFSTVPLGFESAVLMISGEIDIVSAPPLRENLRVRVQEYRTLVVDFSGVDFFGSAGLGLFDTLEQAERDKGLEFEVVYGRSVARMLRAAALDAQWPSCASIYDAVREVETRGHRSLAPAV